MDKTWKLIFLFTLLLTSSGCDNEKFETGIIRVRLERPADYMDISLDSIQVMLTNQTQNTTFTALTNTAGEVEFELTAGICLVSIHKKITEGNTDYIANGGLSEIRFRAGGEIRDLTIPLEVSSQGRLLIEEVYFSSCMRPDGKTLYMKDQYMTLVNNSDEVIYLDGYCVGQAAPGTTPKPSNWMAHTDMKELPLFMMCWQFPGKGDEHPILPGERQAIAINAIDHTAGENGIPASMDLSKVKWAFWNSVLTSSQISAGPLPLNLVWRGAGFAYVFTVSGPTVLLFLPDRDMSEWIADPTHIRTEPNTTLPMRYLHIPATWVQDAVNVVSSVATVSNTRIPLSIDAAPGVAFPSGSGKALRRKRLEEGGRRSWTDTNNTAADFEEVKPILKP